jgi:hypothetical protein
MLYELLNPHECIHNHQKARLQQHSLEILNNEKPNLANSSPAQSIVFVHGVDYGTPSEVVRDLIIPFERHSKVFAHDHIGSYRIFFYFWFSKINLSDTGLNAEDADHAEQSLGQLLTSPRRLYQSLFSWRRKINDCEQVAQSHAKALSKYLESLAHLSTGSTFNPIIISHSMGSYLTAHALTNYFQDRQGEIIPTWWNLQPAVAAKDFHGDGPFACLSDIYGNQLKSFRLWYSRVDLVLTLACLLGQKSLAAGLVGIKSLAPRCKDVTLQALEAHGSLSLWGAKRCFFERTADAIRAEAEQLLSDQQLVRL